jgi:hypothetical protein
MSRHKSNASFIFFPYLATDLGLSRRLFDLPPVA